MQKITHISGKTIPLATSDVDTDLIIPAQYLTSVSKKGYGENLFRRLKEADSDFVFNQPRFADATILISKENFGCGSSREHAVWALTEAGIQAVIAISFGDIFYNNSAKNGLFLIQLPEKVIAKMLDSASRSNYVLKINIEEQSIASSENKLFNFEVESFRKYCFLNGMDDLDYLLNHSKQIDAYQKKARATRFIPSIGE